MAQGRTWARKGCVKYLIIGSHPANPDFKEISPMPKEIAHISIARSVVEKLPDQSLFSRAISGCPNLFLYGAVAPDTFYYYLLGPDLRSTQKLTKPFHTSDSSCLDPVFNLLRINGHDKDKTLAFTGGLLSHMATDTVFHPMIYYFCGHDDLHVGATARHRAFETALDFYFITDSVRQKKTDLNRIMIQLEISPTELVDLFERLFSLEKNRQRLSIKLAVKEYLLANQILKNRFIYKIIKSLHQYGLGIPGSIEALFYPSARPFRLSFFRNTLYYRDTKTGKPLTTTIDRLVENTVQQTVHLLGKLESAIKSNQKRAEIRSDPAWSFFRPDLSKQAFRFWYNRPGLRRMLIKEITRSNR